MYLFHKRQTKAQRLGLSVNQTKENYQLELVKIVTVSKKNEKLKYAIKCFIFYAIIIFLDHKNLNPYPHMFNNFMNNCQFKNEMKFQMQSNV